MINARFSQKLLVGLIAVWVAAGLVIQFIEAWANPFLAIPALIVWSLAGLGLLVVMLWRLRKAGRRRGLLIGAAAVALAWTFLVFAGGSVSWAGAWWRFSELKPDYMEIIAALGVDPGVDGDTWRSAEFGYYLVSAGPPLRVAFVWPGGAIDNWSGVIYDPTGFVMEANSFKSDFSNWFDPDLADVKQVFPGETLFGCRPLEGPFYFCWFT